MSQELKKGKLFVKEVLARLKGDDAEVKASKIARKAFSAVQSQISALEGKEIDLEISVEDGEELLNNAKFPVEMITDGQIYIGNIRRAQEALDSAKEELSAVKESIEYFKGLTKEF